MAVPVEAGKENVIRFEYTTPGLFAGILISVIAFLLLLAYYLLFRYLRKKHPEKYGIQKYAHLKYINAVDMIKAEKAYTYNVIENCRILSAAAEPNAEEKLNAPPSETKPPEQDDTPAEPPQE